MFSSKRGEAVDVLMHPSFIMFVAVMVLLYLLWFVHGLGSDLTYEKKFLATDMAITVDSLLAAKDNVILYYLPQREEFTPKFTYSFEKNKIIVFEDVKSEKSAGIYYFTSDPGIKFEKTKLKFNLPYVLPRFSLIGNELKIDDAHNKDKDKINIYKLNCHNEKFDYGKITLDPAHGYDAELDQGTKGVISGNLKEYVLTREISNIAKTLDTYKLLGDLTRDADIFLPIESRKSKIKNSLVSININDKENMVKAYINYNSDKRKQSLKLACELVNEISSILINNNIEITGISVIPVIPEHKSDKQLGILVKNKPAVVLEIGSTKIQNTFSQNNKKAIAGGMLSAIKNAQK